MRRWVAALLVFGCARALAQAPEEYEASARVRRVEQQGATTLDAEQARARPAALAEAPRALLDAPGVARSSFAGNELVVWGAAGNETRVYLDGVEIPSLFHSAGFRTTVHPVLLDAVSLTPGAPAARYGRGLGGVVELDTVPLRAETGLSLSADAIDSSLSGRAGNEHVSIRAGARYGYLDRVAHAVAAASERVLALPSHADGALKLALRADARTELALTWVGARDRVEVARSDAEQRRTWSFHSLALKLERRYRDAARVRITPFVGIAEQRERSVYSALPLTQSARSLSFGLRAEYARSIRWFGFSVGLDFKGSRDRLARSGTLTLPAREGDITLFGQVPVDAIARDAWRTTLLSVAPHLTLSFQLGALTLEPALRLENVLISASRAIPTDATVPETGVDRFYTFLEPRLRVRYRFSDALSAEARAGVVHQAPSSADLSAVLGSPTLRPARASHACAGPRLTLPRAFVIELVGYYRYLTDLAVRSDQTPPALASALVAGGQGASYGGSLSVRGAPADGLTVTGSYTLGRSTRREADGRERLFDRDQTHVLSLLLSYAAERWSSALGLRAASGSPRTRVTGSYLDVTSGRMEPLFGQQNAARLPFYVQLNLHAELLAVRAPLRVLLLLDVLNLTNRKNVEQIAYDANFSRRSDVVGLPLLAMLGLRVEY